MDRGIPFNFCVDPVLMQRAEGALRRLGISMSTALDLYLNQIAQTGEIPFPVSLPAMASDVNADVMSRDELDVKLKRGVADVDAGRTRNAKEAFHAHLSVRT